MASKQSDHLAEGLPWALRKGQTGQREPKENQVTQTIEEKNKAFVLEAFDTLFNKRDYAAAERFWSPNYIQHSAHIPPGREPHYGDRHDQPDPIFQERRLTVANGDYVLL